MKKEEMEKMGFNMMEKPRLQLMYCDFLEKAGYEHSLEEQGDVAFIYKDHNFAIEIYDEDPYFGRLCLKVNAEFDEETIMYAYIAASEASGSCNFTKVYIRDGNFGDGKQYILFAIGYLLDHPGDFKKNLERMLEDMLSAYQAFGEVMDTLINSDQKKE